MAPPQFVICVTARGVAEIRVKPLWRTSGGPQPVQVSAIDQGVDRTTTELARNLGDHLVDVKWKYDP
jgi:hypothetical protein